MFARGLAFVYSAVDLSGTAAEPEFSNPSWNALPSKSNPLIRDCPRPGIEEAGRRGVVDEDHRLRGGAAPRRVLVVRLNPIVYLEPKSAHRARAALLVTTLAGAAALIWSDWERFRPLFEGYWKGVQSIWHGFAGWVAGIFSGNIRAAADGLRTAWDGFRQTAVAGFRAIIQFGNTLINFIDTTFGTSIRASLAALGTAWDGLREAWGAALGGVRAMLLEWVGWFQANIVQPILNGIATVKGALSGLSSSINSIPKMKSVGEITGEFAPEGMPARAIGGPVRAGTLYRINEKGEEGFMPSVNGGIVSNSLLKQMARSQMGGGARAQHGQADVRIKVEGADVRGARVKTSGGLFRKVELDCGVAMARA